MTMHADEESLAPAWVLRKYSSAFAIKILEIQICREVQMNNDLLF